MTTRTPMLSVIEHSSSQVFKRQELHAFSDGQITEGPLIKPEDVVKNGTTKLNTVAHISNVNESILPGKNNSTIYEDEEAFQDLNDLLHYSQCNEPLLMIFIEMGCLDKFKSHMVSLGKDNWCNLEAVLRDYNTLTHCMENYTGLLHCYYPNTIVQDIFVEVHKEYFNLCPTKDDTFPDAPASVILMLTLLPVSVIPIMVYMVIKKSSVID